MRDRTGLPAACPLAWYSAPAWPGRRWLVEIVGAPFLDAGRRPCVAVAPTGSWPFDGFGDVELQVSALRPVTRRARELLGLPATEKR